MRVLFALATVLPLVHGKNGAACDIVEPMALRFGSVTVIDSPAVVMSPHKALGLIFGSARKLLAMGFGTTANATFVPDSDRLCNATDPKVKGCLFWRGGVFTPTLSDTWRKDARTTEYNGSVSNEGWDYLNGDTYAAMGDDPLTQFTRGWDTVDLGDKTLYSYPFSIIENSSFPFGTGMVGLASDSVFLRMSVAEKIAPSRTWALDYGRLNDITEEPGELVIGGYNPRKATYKEFTNYTIFPNKNRPCPLQVDVESMKWGKIDLMKGQDPFMACLEPAYWSMIPPLKVQQNWNRSLVNDYKNVWIGQSWEYFRYNVTANSTFPDDDLEITLNKGFTVKIPKEALVKRAEWLNDWEGGYVVINKTIDVRMGTAGFPDGVDPKLPFLGGPFLSQVYLTVDYENDVFSLAPINRGNSDPAPLRKLACDSSNFTAPPPPAVPDKRPGPNNTGKIVGGAVGGGVGFLAICFALWFFVCRKPKQQEESVVEQVPAPVEEQVVAAAVATDKKEDIPRYTSPFSPYGGYAPPPPESVTSTLVSPYPTFTGNHYGPGAGTWATSPDLPPQQLPTNTDDHGVMLASTRLDPVEMGPGRTESMPLSEQAQYQHPDQQQQFQGPYTPYSVQTQTTGTSEITQIPGSSPGPHRDVDLL